MIKKYIDNKTKILILLSILYAFLSLIVYQLTHLSIHLWMFWNLVLAIIPFFLSILLIDITDKKNNQLIFLFSVFWILFFPNAPYMITDFIHISTIHFYTSGEFNILSWIRLIHIALGALLGTAFGMLALANIHDLLKQHQRKNTVYLMMFLIALVSGYAIYIGRLLRFNTWDILRPLVLGKALIHNLNLFSLSCTLLFAFYILFTYTIYYQLIKKDDNIKAIKRKK